MRRNPLAALALVGSLAITASTAAAQEYRTSVGWNGGIVMTTSLNDGAGDGVELKPDVTWAAGVHYDRWLGGGRLGGRLSAGLGRHTLPWTQGDRTIFSYWGDASAMLRLLPPRPGSAVAPFLSAGVGFVRWGLGDGPPTAFGPASAQYGGDEGFQVAGVAGFGFDIVTPWRWGEGPLVFRAEARDYLQPSSPFDPTNGDAADFGAVHSLVITLGLHTGVGTAGSRY